MVRHQIHVVTHSIDAVHESWCSPDAAVVLLRERGQPTWRAVLGLVVVSDAERLNGRLALEEAGGDAAMRADSAHALAQRLAQQENVHLVFDA